MPVQVEYDPSRETIVDPKTGRNIRRYQKEPCEHPIRLTEKITIWAGSQTLIPDDHWNEYINHPNPNVRNKIIPEQLMPLDPHSSRSTLGTDSAPLFFLAVLYFSPLDMSCILQHYGLMPSARG